MTYNKPEVEVLGDAGRVIQAPKSNTKGDGSNQLTTPAYELDESE